MKASLNGANPRAVVQGPASVRAFSVAGLNLAFTRTDDRTPAKFGSREQTAPILTLSRRLTRSL